MTDVRIAELVRDLASDYHNPLSVACVQCHAPDGEHCVDAADQEEPLHVTDGVHPVRRVDARITAESHVRSLLRELNPAPRATKEIP